MKIRFACFMMIASGAMLFLSSCGNDEKTSATTDSMSRKDSLKKAMAEDLPPSSDIKQFNWLYSGFVHAATTGDDSLFNTFIHPAHGLWIIHSNGAMPSFTNVKKISEFELPNGKKLLPFDRDKMMTAPKEEELPVVDCDKKDFYSKSGCFTSQRNVFREEKIWQYAGLTPADDKEVNFLSTTITRTVINTETYCFYFSLIDGGWYLTFLDIRKPCSA